MGNYEQLKDAVTAVIKANGKKEITGQILQDTLLAMINSLGSGAVFAGIATPSTKPGTPDQNVFYIAGQDGTYTNFGGAVLKNEVATFTIKNGTWQKETLVNILDASQGNRALYVAAGAVYNKQTGFYELNGLTDITEEQMREIYVYTSGAINQNDLTQRFSGLNIRTNIPFKAPLGNYDSTFVMIGMCANNENIETINFVFRVFPIKTGYAFAGCRKLFSINSILDFRLFKGNIVSTMFVGCNALVHVLIHSLKSTISFSDSPLLSLESLQYLITNAANTSAITVTVHADVYAKIQDETQADWHALIASAQEKQITFTTA